MINLQQRSPLQKQITATEYASPLPAASRLNQVEHGSSNITLNSIMTEYLATQHALCKNPISTCPQFDLFAPHRCPDPQPKSIKGGCINFASRYHLRQSGCMVGSRSLDRRLVHSKFFMVETLPSAVSFPTCCDFKPSTASIVAGMQSGEVEVYNEVGESFTYPCHTNCVTNVKCSRDGTLLLTSSYSRSKMWAIKKNYFEMMVAFDEEKYLEFSKMNEDKILGTNGKVISS